MSTKLDPVDFDYISAEQVRCRNDNVLVRYEELPETTASGLVALPRSDYAREIDGKAAVVVGVGDGPSYKSNCEKCGKPRYPFGMSVKPGDRVIVDGKNRGERIWVNGIEHRLVREAELLAVLEN